MTLTSNMNANNNVEQRNDCDSTQPNREKVQQQTPSCKLSSSNVRNNRTSSPSIEKLQHKQGELQEELDQVLLIANNLAKRKNRRLNKIIESQEYESPISLHLSVKNGDTKADSDERQGLCRPNEEESEEEEEDELLEFQQIENELRISELNRQLRDVQEELRIKLYKSLVLKINNGFKSQQVSSRGAQAQNETCSRNYERQEHLQPAQQQHSVDHGHNSEHVSRSRVVTTSSVPVTSLECASTPVNNLNQQIDLTDGAVATAGRLVGSSRTIGELETKTDPPSFEVATNQPNKEIRNQQEQQFNMTELMSQDSVLDCQALNAMLASLPKRGVTSVSSSTSASNSPSSSSSSTSSTSAGNVSHTPSTSTSRVANNDHSNQTRPQSPSGRQPAGRLPSQLMQVQGIPITGGSSSPVWNGGPGLASTSSHRSSSANSDLERIEEDEEDGLDQVYGNSDHLRAIYEEKLSPFLRSSLVGAAANSATSAHSSSSNSSSSNNNNNSHHSNGFITGLPSKLVAANDSYRSQQQAACATSQAHQSAAARNAAASYESERKSNRPLTLYLPKGGEDVDLVEHVQALGHDLQMCADDVKVDTHTACGYLWKCCSNSNKKWLKRWFFFDRQARQLVYCHQRDDIVKKGAKNCIDFELIHDVYVDHRMSGICERDRACKRFRFVFVLATYERKYLLASSRPETMRIWIDILYTAVKPLDEATHLLGLNGENNAHHRVWTNPTAVVERQ